MSTSCGGCRGIGAHRRWCPEAVGRHAAFLGKLSQQADSLGDSIGPNEYGAANHVWAAAGLLREAALKAKSEWEQQRDLRVAQAAVDALNESEPE